MIWNREQDPYSDVMTCVETRCCLVESCSPVARATSASQPRHMETFGCRDYPVQTSQACTLAGEVNVNDNQSWKGSNCRKPSIVEAECYCCEDDFA
jgi:hypothetical protein